MAEMLKRRFIRSRGSCTDVIIYLMLELAAR